MGPKKNKKSAVDKTSREMTNIWRTRNSVFFPRLLKIIIKEPITVPAGIWHRALKTHFSLYLEQIFPVDSGLHLPVAEENEPQLPHIPSADFRDS